MKHLDPRAVYVTQERREYDAENHLVAQSGYSGPVYPADREGCHCPECGAYCSCRSEEAPRRDDR